MIEVKSSIRKWVLLLGIVLFVCGAAAARNSSIVFHGEKIVVTVLGDRIRVSGDYHFRNPSAEAAELRLFYPFPVDSAHPFPDSTSVESGGVSVPFRAGGRGVAFTAEVPAESVRTYRVRYEQRCDVPEGCYILTTTAAWPEPLAEADFEVIIPEPYALVDLSYEAEKTEGGDGTDVYRFRRVRFLPDRDLCVRWRDTEE